MIEPNWRKKIVDELKELYRLHPDEKKLLNDTMQLATRLRGESQTSAKEYGGKEEAPSVMFSADAASLYVLTQYAALGMLEFKTARILG